MSSQPERPDATPGDADTLTALATRIAAATTQLQRCAQRQDWAGAAAMANARHVELQRLNAHVGGPQQARARLLLETASRTNTVMVQTLADQRAHLQHQLKQLRRGARAREVYTND